MRKYELLVLLNPASSDEERTTLLDEVKEELKDGGLTIFSEDVWGERDLAYAIQGSKTGYYILYLLEGEQGNIMQVTRSFNVQKNIWRHMFVRIDTIKEPKTSGKGNSDVGDDTGKNA